MNQFLIGFYSNPPEPEADEDKYVEEEIRPVPEESVEEPDQPIPEVPQRNPSRIPDHVLRRYESRDSNIDN